METKDDSNIILILGNNYDGCLLTGDINDVTELKPNKTDLFQEFREKLIRSIDIQLGPKFGAIIDENNEIHLWGRKISEKEEQVLLSPLKIEIPIKIKPIRLSCGMDHLLILSNDNRVFSLGKGIHGELGLGDKRQLVEFPTEICLDKIEVISVLAGIRTSFLLAKNGDVYCYGSNRFNELGLMNSDNFKEKSLLKHYFTPVKNQFLSNIESIKIGFKHSLFVQKDNEKIYGCGSNLKGVLGTGDDNYDKIFPLTDLKQNWNFEEISKIYASWNNTLVLSKNCVYITGEGNFGQLTINTPKLNKFVKIDFGNICIEEIFHGSESFFVKDKDDNIYSWGWNEHYNLGLNHSENVYNPQYLRTDYKINKVLLSGAYCFMIPNSN